MISIRHPDGVTDRGIATVPVASFDLRARSAPLQKRASRPRSQDARRRGIGPDTP
jgi:hypothetical protein